MAKKDSDVKLRKKVRDIIKEYNSTGYDHNPAMDTLVEVAKRWYDLKPLPDDFDLAMLTEKQMRDLVKKDERTWRIPITKELVRRGYVQVVYHNMYYIDGDGDENTCLVLFKDDEFDPAKCKHVVNYVDDNLTDDLFNADSRKSDGKYGDEARAWIKDIAVQPVIEKLESNPDFKVLGKDDFHYYTKYHCSFNDTEFDLFQTFEEKIAVDGTGKEAAMGLLRETFPEAFTGNRWRKLSFTMDTEINDSFAIYS